MLELLVKYNLANVVTNIVMPCRKGKFILVYCSSDLKKKIGMDLLNANIPLKRGVYTYKGIVILAVEKNVEFEKYFDSIIEVKNA